MSFQEPWFFHKWENCGFFGNNCVVILRNIAKIRKLYLRKYAKWGSKPANQFQVQQAGGQSLGDCVGCIGKVLDKHIGNGILTVDQVKNFEGRPDVFKVPKWVVAAAVAFFAVHQQCAEADIDTDIGIDRQVAPVTQVSGDIKGQVTAIEEIQKGFQVLVGRQIILEEEAEGEQAVGGPPDPAGAGL